MCGITGFVGQVGRMLRDEMEVTARGMAAALHHRGPDDSGVWTDAECGVALGHRRLSIIDLTEQGHQPMISADGRFVIVFNGEIYNFIELRGKLQQLGHAFRSTSDTEVVLSALVQWGVEKAIECFVGMFAFAAWDRQDRALFLARDRLGEKPLFYGWADGALLFGSELKALRAYPGWKPEINRDALALFMRHDFIPGPHSIYRGIHKLPPGAFLRLPMADMKSGSLPDPVTYWDLGSVVENAAREPFRGTEEEATLELERVLRDAVASQMVADVPLGAFLSGGIDSSMIVALMQAQSRQPVKTFTIGFHEADYNEAVHAKAVAQHLGTEHTELYLTPAEAMAVIPRLPSIYDEPFSDSSQIPTLLLAQMARRHVTVSLSGDGGDELFAGYPRYPLAQSLWDRIGRVPRPLRTLSRKVIKSVEAGRWQTVLGWTARLLPGDHWPGRVGDRLHKLADRLEWKSVEELYRQLVSRWEEPNRLVLGAKEPSSWTDAVTGVHVSDAIGKMQFLDMASYLPDDILVKVDRAAMAVSLETRVPFLDHRVVEFVWRLPLESKLRAGESKRLLKRVLHRYVPQALIERPKMGFGIPVDAWLRGPLREWAESLLSPSRLRREGFLNAELVTQRWQEHVSGRRQWQFHIWAVLMFQAWLAELRP